MDPDATQALADEMEKRAIYWKAMKALQKAAPKSMRPALTRASNAIADPKVQLWMGEMAEGLATDALVFGEGGVASMKALPGIIKSHGAKALVHPTVWSLPTYKGFQEAGKGLYAAGKKVPRYLPGTEAHVGRLAAKTASLGQKAVYYRALAHRIALPAAVGAALALPTIGFQMDQFKGLQEGVPEDYQPAALAGGMLGAGFGGALGGHSAQVLFGEAAQRPDLFPNVAKFMKKHPKWLMPAAAGAGFLASMPGFMAGKETGEFLKRDLDPSATGEVLHALGIR